MNILPKKMNKILLRFFSVFLFVMSLTIIVSCESNEISDFEEELVAQDDTVEEPDEEEENDDDTEDTSNLTTYENSAKRILDTNCIECHNINNASAGVRLENFSNAINEANEGRMIAAMTDLDNPMPPSGNLPDNVIQEIMDWIEDGLLEN